MLTAQSHDSAYGLQSGSLPFPVHSMAVDILLDLYLAVSPDIGAQNMR